MLNTAIVGLGWWGKTLVKAARDFGAPINFVRGVTLEPDTVRDFAADTKSRSAPRSTRCFADPQFKAVVLATPHTKHPRAGRGGWRRPASTSIAKSRSR